MKFTQTLVRQCIAFLHFRLLDHKTTEELSIRLTDENIDSPCWGRGMDISSINVTEGYTSGLKGHSLKV